MLHSLKNLAQSQLNRMGWERMSPAVDLACGAKVVLQTPSDWEIFKEIFVDGEYDEPIMDALDGEDGSSCRIVDLGANIGLFSARAAELREKQFRERRLRLLSVEGNEATFGRLTNSVGRIRKERAEVTLCQGLVGDRSGDAFIYSGSHAGSHMVVPEGGRRSRLGFRNSFALPSHYVDVAAQLGKDESIDLIKCDIEGSELKFLEAYPDLLQRTQRIVIELHPLWVDMDKCRGLLKEQGFVLKRQIRDLPTMALEYYTRVN
jgi:FkbM family methyltransferase